MSTHVFFGHMVLAIDARVVVPPQATVNLLVEVNDRTLLRGGKERDLKVSALTDLQKVELAREIAQTAALDYLKSEPEFSKLPVQRFVDFNLAHTPTYISIRPPPSKILLDGSIVCRLAETEAEKLRSKPLSG
ncbi:MAG: hypothetical protein M3R10_01130 [Verrucomicrobiota bacterium]|nr:hypothetical protein [Verrucomicrobiota bacterium]